MLRLPLAQKSIPDRTVFNLTATQPKGDGINDDTSAINEAITYANSIGGGTIYLPFGTYLVSVLSQNGSAIILKDNVKLKLSPSAKIQLAPNNFDNYAIVELNGVSNVNIEGGSVVGDRDTHTGTTGEWGMGIHVVDSSNVDIRDINISKCWGDGLYIGSLIATGYTENITYENVICDNNRRNGITIESARHLHSLNCQGNNTNGAAPESGLQIEPNFTTEYLDDIIIDGFTSSDNAGAGIWMWLGTYAGSVNPMHVKFTDHKDYGSGLGTYKDFIRWQDEGYNVEAIVTPTFTNLINMNNWVGDKGTATLDGNNVLTLTADGTGLFSIASQVLNLAYPADTHFYYQFEGLVDTTANVFKGEIRDGSWYGTQHTGVADEGSPFTAGQWLKPGGLMTIDTGGIANLTVVLRQEYADAATATGKTLQVKDVSFFDLAPFGDYVPTEYECNVLFRDLVI